MKNKTNVRLRVPLSLNGVTTGQPVVWRDMEIMDVMIQAGITIHVHGPKGVDGGYLPMTIVSIDHWPDDSTPSILNMRPMERGIFGLDHLPKPSSGWRAEPSSSTRHP